MMGVPAEKKEVLLNRLHDFATRHKGDLEAAEALMSFFRGECQHHTDKRGRCELCGAFYPHKVKN